MGPDLVVVPSPELDGLSGAGNIGEPVLIEAFVTQLAVEAFDVAVLRRLARSDEVKRDAAEPVNAFETVCFRVY
jgi:hypothetical protein